MKSAYKFSEGWTTTFGVERNVSTLGGREHGQRLHLTKQFEAGRSVEQLSKRDLINGAGREEWSICETLSHRVDPG